MPASILKLKLPRKELPKCKPHIMPFHIDYTGPAPLKTFFHIKPAKANVGAPEPDEIIESTEDSIAVDPDVDKEEGSSSAAVAVVAAVAVTKPSGVERTDSEATLGGETTEAQSQTTLAEESTIVVDETSEVVSTVMAESSTSVIDADDSTTMISTSATGVAKSDTPNIIDTGVKYDGRRYISSFRGRIIHGLDVPLPEGYSGFVFAVDPETSSSTSSTKPRPSTSSLRSSPRKRPSKATMVEEDDGMLVDEEEREDEGPERFMTPVKSVDTLTVWHPDFPVYEGRDEYIRAMEEWSFLAREIHRQE